MLNVSNKKIIFDLDGVLNFLKVDPEIDKDKSWKTTLGFFERRLPNPHGIELLTSLKNLVKADSLFICSTIPIQVDEDRVWDVRLEKIKWIVNTLSWFPLKSFLIHDMRKVPQKVGMFPVNSSSEFKWILIDDYNPNLEHWQSAGGIGVKYFNTKDGYEDGDFKYRVTDDWTVEEFHSLLNGF